MRSEAIYHAALLQLVQSGSLQATQVIGQAGGWGVLVKVGEQARSLTTARSRQTRVFKNLETLVAYLKEIGIDHFEIDAAAYSPDVPEAHRRPDRAVAMRRAHAAAAHDVWFRAQVRQGVADADKPDAVWLQHETVKEDLQRQRTALARTLAARRGK